MPTADAIVPSEPRCYALRVGWFEVGIVVSVMASGCAESSPAMQSQARSSSSASAIPLASKATASSAAATALVDLHPLTISFQGKPIARLFADGRTESAGQNAPGTVLVPGPTLHADGTMVMTKAGVTARLDDKGEIYVIQPPGVTPHEPLFGRITGDELKLTSSDQLWSVRVRGNLIEFGKDNSSQIDGDVTQNMRHTALVMAAAFYIDGAIAAP
jgi:hypothetical protein